MIYNKNYLNRRLLIVNSRIYTAILKYNYENFSLVILEYYDINFKDKLLKGTYLVIKV
jgi:hypothetical protein